MELLRSNQRCRVCGARMWWSGGDRRWWTLDEFGGEPGIGEPLTAGIAVPETCPEHRDVAQSVMTETELIDDLSRLLREGLVAIDADQMDGFDEDPSAAPRFYVTARGREVCHDEAATEAEHGSR